MLNRIGIFTLRAFAKRTIPTYNHRLLFTSKTYFPFTSSSDSTQTQLLEEVEAKVFQVLKTAAKCKKEKLTRTASFQQLGFDSLDSVQLVVAMQEYFGFDIPNEEAEKIANVQAAINTFYRHLNSKIANKMVEGTNSQIDNEKK